MHPKLLALCGQQVSRARYSTVDANGNNTYGTAETLIPVRIDSWQTEMGQPEDHSQESSVPYHTLSLIAEQRPTNGWAIGDKITLSTGDIVYVTMATPVYDETSTVHHVVITAETGAIR